MLFPAALACDSRRCGCLIPRLVRLSLRPRHAGAVPAFANDEDSNEKQTFRGSIARPQRSLSTLRSTGSPRPHARLAYQPMANVCWTGFPPAWAPAKFPSPLHDFLSSRLGLAQSRSSAMREPSRVRWRCGRIIASPPRRGPLTYAVTPRPLIAACCLLATRTLAPNSAQLPAATRLPRRSGWNTRKNCWSLISAAKLETQNGIK